MNDRWSWLLGRHQDAGDGPVPATERDAGSDPHGVTEPTGSSGSSDAPSIQMVPIALLDPNPFQPRTIFDQGGLEELAASIRERGVLQPVLVRASGERYELVAGERRVRAAELAGLTVVPAIVIEADPGEMAIIALVENLQRRDLNPLEEAEGYRRLGEEFRLTQEELAQKVGKSQSSIANKLRLLRLPEPVRDSISREIISERHARALLALTDEHDQLLALAEITRQNLTVRDAESLIRGMIERRGGVQPEARSKGRRVVRVFKDCRLFRNSLLALVREMEKGGAVVKLDEESGADFYEARVRVYKKDAAQD